MLRTPLRRPRSVPCRSFATKRNLRLVIVGGVAGGATAAARARRLSEEADIHILERGPDVSFANCGLPYHLSGEIADRNRLSLFAPDSLAKTLNIRVSVGREVIKVDRAAKTVHVRMAGGATDSVPYDKLILSPGAAPIRPPIPGVDGKNIFVLRTLADMDAILRRMQDAPVKRALVVGAGFIGLEVVEALQKKQFAVRLVETRASVLPQLDPEMTARLHDELRSRGIRLSLNEAVTAFSSAADGTVTAAFRSDKAPETFDLVLLSVGVAPESALASSAELAVEGRAKAIAVNDFMQTSDPDIYAIGDACSTRDRIFPSQRAWVPLGGPANRQGRIAVDHIFMGEKALPYPGSLGTAIVRVFDTTAAITGWSEARLKAANIPYETATVTGYQHASYFPNATPVTLKILWETGSGRLLGAQAVGSDGVDKRIDVLSTAIAARQTTADLAYLELSYAPPYGAARDVVNTAGLLAENIRAGLVKPAATLPDVADSTQVLLDVRDTTTASLHPLPGAVNIPFPELRAQLASLDRAKHYTTSCTLGKTSYFASRILMQAGYDARSLIGGVSLLSPQKGRDVPSNAPPSALPPAAKEVALDACGIACPGPIMLIRKSLETLPTDAVLRVTASDPGFANDFPAFCRTAGVECLSVERERGLVVGRLRKPAQAQQTDASVSARKNLSIVVFSDELDKVLASLVIANGHLASSGDGRVTLFFTFWGLAALRKPGAPSRGKPLLEKTLGAMLPSGTNELKLSHLNFAGIGTWLMKTTMKSKKLPMLPDLLASARESGRVRLVACTMSMDALGIRREELIDEVELGGVADFLEAGRTSQSTLFI